ncbi:hypothetical protein [Mucilaginibacter sp. 22184]|uniref:hypothetical protein n=1 Tax=Mucilaginibacter sp. 22184 TaxID=3453887 RepID=UPI003F877473
MMTSPTDKNVEQTNGLVLSYLTQRNIIGFSGMLLPLALAAWPKRPAPYGIEPSISDYFFTNRGDLLVVFLCVIGVFLITYKGYTWVERALTITAALAGMGVAFVPTRKICGNCEFSAHTEDGRLFLDLFGEGWHILFAAIFLLSLAAMSLFFFPLTDEPAQLRTAAGRKSKKAKRNRIYRICGIIMVVSVAILGLYFLLKPDVKGFPVVYTFETIAIEAFGLSWLTKGETFLPDGQHYIVRGLRQLGRSKS